MTATAAVLRAIENGSFAGSEDLALDMRARFREVRIIVARQMQSGCVRERDGVLCLTSRGRDKIAAKPWQRNSKPQPEPDPSAGPRNCLRCGARFDSEWKGIRICKHCKGSAEWKAA